MNNKCDICGITWGSLKGYDKPAERYKGLDLCKDCSRKKEAIGIIGNDDVRIMPNTYKKRVEYKGQLITVKARDRLIATEERKQKRIDDRKRLIVKINKDAKLFDSLGKACMVNGVFPSLYSEWVKKGWTDFLVKDDII